MKLSVCIILGFFSFAVPGSANGQKITDGATLIRAMHDRYEKTWYQTVTFTQKSTTYNPDGTTKVETWYEAAKLPGKLRIDIGPASDGKCSLMVDGTYFRFEQGKQVSSQPYLNMLLVLGFDVYRQPTEATLGQLKQEGFDVAKFHEDSWQGEPVYVVGAEKGDSKTKQFWVEKKRLLFLRIVEPDRSDPQKPTDILFADYRALRQGLIAARVEVHKEGKLVFSEDYSDIKIDVPLEPAMFDPSHFQPRRSEK